MEPFVKWAGGKRQLLEKLNARIPKNGYKRYFEPFVGAGAFWLDLRPQTSIVNDVNEQLMHCYKIIKDNPKELIRKIDSLDHGRRDKDGYLANRDRYNQKIINGEFDVETAALMIWLNKNCFNGLYRTNKQGLFNVPYNNKQIGKSVNNLNIMNISYYLNDSNVQLLCKDFEEVCADCKKGDFIFFDSPYVPTSKTAGFVDYTKESFKEEDHRRLASLYRELDKKGCYCLLTNSNTDFVKELYEGFEIVEVDVNRAINSDAKKRTGKEVIITNYEY